MTKTAEEFKEDMKGWIDNNGIISFSDGEPLERFFQMLHDPDFVHSVKGIDFVYVEQYGVELIKKLEKLLPGLPEFVREVHFDTLPFEGKYDLDCINRFIKALPKTVTRITFPEIDDAGSCKKIGDLALSQLLEFAQNIPKHITQLGFYGHHLMALRLEDFEAFIKAFHSSMTTLDLGGNRLSSLEYIKVLPSNIRCLDLQESQLYLLTEEQQKELAQSIPEHIVFLGLRENYNSDQQLQIINFLQHLHPGIETVDLRGKTRMSTDWLVPRLPQTIKVAITNEETIDCNQWRQTHRPIRVSETPQAFYTVIAEEWRIVVDSATCCLL